MTTALVGIVLALAIGIACRWLDIPVPAPPRLQGALLVVAMTAGFLAAGFRGAASAVGASKASAPKEARKARRFKNFLRRRQPVAETKRPCH